MNKKNNLALFALLIGIFTLFISNISAQKTVSVKVEQPAQPCAGEKFVMPQTISVNNDAFANYIKVASLPRNERQLAFGKLSNEQKASFVKVQFAMQLVKRQNLTKEQRDFILDSMLKVSADLYDRENPQKVALADKLSQETENKAFGLFTQKDAFEILEGLGASKSEDVALLQKYVDLLKLGMQQRKRVAKEMPIIVRANIWKTQLAYHLVTSSFSREQKEFISESIFNIESVFEASTNLSGEERDKYLRALESSMFKVFTKAEAYAVFMTVGIQDRVRDNLEFLENSNAEDISHKFLRLQKFTFNSSEVSAQSLRNKNKSPQFVVTSEQLCMCRWYCDPIGYSCNSSVCVHFNQCGPYGT